MTKEIINWLSELDTKKREYKIDPKKKKANMLEEIKLSQEEIVRLEERIAFLLEELEKFKI